MLVGSFIDLNDAGILRIQIERSAESGDERVNQDGEQLVFWITRENV
jgi:hypothetical protein